MFVSAAINNNEVQRGAAQYKTLRRIGVGGATNLWAPSKINVSLDETFGCVAAVEGTNALSKATLSVPLARPAALKSVLKECETTVRYRRTNACGHDIEMKCGDAMRIVIGLQFSLHHRISIPLSMRCPCHESDGVRARSRDRVFR